MATRRRGVVLAGAGYAGLSCAHFLQKLGIEDWEAVEARDRPGGRAFSDRVMCEGNWIDHGPEFFGGNHETLLRLADEYGVERMLMRDYEGPFSPILDGCGLTLATRQAVESEMHVIADKLVQLARPVNLATPWLGPDAANLDRVSLGDWLKGQELSALARSTFEVQIVANHGVSLDKLSLLAFLVLIKAHGTEKYLTQTELYRLRGGAQELALRLAASFGERIRYNTKIVAVTAFDREVVIETAAGDRIFADYLVLTVPPSVWPTIRFTPALPAKMRMQMGMNVKVFAVLKGRETFQAGLNPHAILRGGLLQLIWDTTEGQEGPCTVITAFSGGSPAMELCRKSEQELRGLVLRELTECVPNIADRLLAVHFKGWPQDPFTRAGYSAPACGQITEVWPELDRGFGRIIIAGEYRARQWAFVGGAICTGANAAGQIAEEYNGGTNPLRTLFA